MNVIRKLGLFLPLAAAPLLAGCYVHDGPPPRQSVAYYESSPPPPPPAAQVDVVTVSPGPDYVWVGGYQRWDGRAYRWTRGHYERRPYRRSHYEPGHWEGRGRGRIWIEAGWR